MPQQGGLQQDEEGQNEILYLPESCAMTVLESWGPREPEGAGMVRLPGCLILLQRRLIPWAPLQAAFLCGQDLLSAIPSSAAELAAPWGQTPLLLVHPCACWQVQWGGLLAGPAMSQLVCLPWAASSRHWEGAQVLLVHRWCPWCLLQCSFPRH